MKYFDIVNEQDEVIGSAPAQECHSNPKFIHRVVHFTLVNELNGQILITQRPPDVKFDGGKWCFMGEHLLQGDDYPTAVFRGACDELGLCVNNDISLAAGEWCNTIFRSEKQTEFARFFFIYYESGKIIANPIEIVQTKWISRDELFENKQEYSHMTQYWIGHIDWERFARMYST